VDTGDYRRDSSCVLPFRVSHGAHTTAEGGRMTAETPEREMYRLPKDEVDELVDGWREYARNNVEWHEYNQGVHEGIESCANELEELLEEHE